MATRVRVTRNNVNNSQGVHTVSVYALLDQGSLAGDFVSQQALDSLDIQLQTSRMSENKPKLNFMVIDGPMPICSGLNGEFLNDSSRSLVLNVCFCKESNTSVVNEISFEANFRVLPSSPFDLIIGRSTIKQFKLGLLLPSHFFDKELSIRSRPTR